DQLTVGDLEADAAQGVDLDVAQAIRLADVGDLDAHGCGSAAGAAHDEAAGRASAWHSSATGVWRASARPLNQDLVAFLETVGDLDRLVVLHAGFDRPTD